MLRQRSSRVDPDRTGDRGRQRAERVGVGSSRHRRYRAGVECLEDRRLLSAITEFPLPTPTFNPGDLTVGPDGNLWFPEFSGFPFGGADGIGRITPSGAVTEFPLPTTGLQAVNLTVGPDGNLWFPVVDYGGRIGRITPSGAVTEFPLPTTSGDPGALTVGPDGNLWFTEFRNTLTAGGTGRIGRITPSGAVTEFPLPTTGLQADNLTVGPDGNLWFTEFSENTLPAGGTMRIGRITPSGAITEFPLPTTGLQAVNLTVGPDGNLWLAEQGGLVPGQPGFLSRIDRITPSGAVTEFHLHTTSFVPNSLTVGPDGNLWFTEFSENTLPGGGRGRIGRITPSGAITEFPLPTTTGEPGDLTVGPDGNLWFSDFGTCSIGRITPSGAVTEFHLHKVISDPEIPLTPGAPTVGPDGNLWFSDDYTASIGRINPSPPRVTGVVAVAHSRAGTTEIVLSFNEALDPRTTGKLGFYHLAAGVKTRHTLVFSKGLKIARVFYDGSTHQVTLKLAKPRKGAVQLTVRPGIVAADGISSFNAFTAVIS